MTLNLLISLKAARNRLSHEILMDLDRSYFSAGAIEAEI